MFYFPIIDTTWPSWIPFVGGNHFIFFSPIFNFADASISCGIIALLLFYSKYLNEGHLTKKEAINKDEQEQTK
jgi:signal peptidase II